MIGERAAPIKETPDQGGCLLPVIGDSPECPMPGVGGLHSGEWFEGDSCIWCGGCEPGQAHPEGPRPPFAQKTGIYVCDKRRGEANPSV